ncbi:uncharacterized protein BDZ99DRAFT_303034 [Mytilinidion resinicola]|uniref:Uncharacterized protein n=1 Tax=Mytilinidion resinicola TaxID=574789 RepID=A0A6A6YMF3_9PEZI|nr:uncharacterized protein BDZ99DRAFT_303034 [Mytilinidion resinicola]KAF2810056.1 hypothetical protein BDZ99DRAFT_303034 [Mytilinidion resinicola]
MTQMISNFAKCGSPIGRSCLSTKFSVSPSPLCAVMHRIQTQRMRPGHPCSSSYPSPWVKSSEFVEFREMQTESRKACAKARSPKQR